MTRFNDSIKIKATSKNLNTGGKFQLVTNDAHNSHMNIYAYKEVTDNSGQNSVLLSCICVEPDEAIKIRNMFIAAYPLEDFPAKEKTVTMTIEIPERNKSTLLSTVRGLKGVVK